MCCEPPWATAKLTYLGLLVRHACWEPPTPVFSRPTCGPWCSTARWTRPCRRSPSSTSSRPPSTASCSSSSPPAPRQPSCAWKPGGNPQAAFEALLAQVRANPLPAERHVADRRPGRAAVRHRGRRCTRPATWNDLAVALQAASRGDGTDFLELFDCYTGRAAGRQLQQPLRGQRRRQLPGHARPLPGRPAGRRSRPPRRRRPCSGS